MPRRYSRQNDVAGLARKFRRAAGQRLSAAELLLAHEHGLEAVYIAGYAAECALKALILHRKPRRRLAEVTSRLTRGAAGHDLERLKTLVEQRGAPMPIAVIEACRRLFSWSTDLRYEPGIVRSKDARRVVNAAGEILQWVQRNW